MDDIAMSLGGYITEKMIFGDVTTGPSNDLQVSTALARDMVTRYGMSDKIGAMALEGAGGKPLFGGQGMDGKEYSERMGADIDSEVSLIMKTAYDKAEKIIVDYRHVLDAIAKKLIEVQKLMDQGDDRAKAIYETIGVYLGYSIAWFKEFYKINNLLLFLI